MKKISSKIIFIFSCVLILALVLDAVYRGIYHIPYQMPKLIWQFPEITEKYQIVAVGNSHVEEGISFDKYASKSLMLAQSAQSYAYDLAKLQMHEKQIAPGAIIIINASPISFSQITADKENTLQTRYYDGSINPFFIPNIKIEDYVQSQILPFLRTGFVWREKIALEISTGKQDKPVSKNLSPQTPAPTSSPLTQRQKYGKFLSSSDAPADYFYSAMAIEHELASPSSYPKDKLVGSMHFIFHKWYETSGFGKEYFYKNRIDLEKLISYCLAHSWRPILITVPISEVLLEGLLDDFMDLYVYDNIAKTNIQNIPYLDFSKDSRITKNQNIFDNSDHLNKNGSLIFSYVLLQKLIEQGYLDRNDNNYE